MFCVYYVNMDNFANTPSGISPTHLCATVVLFSSVRCVQLRMYKNATG